MLSKIENCRTPEELHNIGVDIDMSPAEKSVKTPLYKAIEDKMATLNDIMAEQSEFTASDVGFEDYNFSE